MYFQNKISANRCDVLGEHPSKAISLEKTTLLQLQLLIILC